MVRNYDTRCQDLAEVFLRDEPSINTPRAARYVAQAIQTAIEDAISYQRHPCECCGTPLGAGDHKDCVYF